MNQEEMVLADEYLKPLIQRESKQTRTPTMWERKVFLLGRTSLKRTIRELEAEHDAAITQLKKMKGIP